MDARPHGTLRDWPPGRTAGEQLLVVTTVGVALTVLLPAAYALEASVRALTWVWKRRAA